MCTKCIRHTHTHTHTTQTQRICMWKNPIATSKEDKMQFIAFHRCQVHLQLHILSAFGMRSQTKYFDNEFIEISRFYASDKSHKRTENYTLIWRRHVLFHYVEDVSLSILIRLCDAKELIFEKQSNLHIYMCVCL